MIRPNNPAVAPIVPLEDRGVAPELTGITDWINSTPTTLAALRGKVVLVHFWTFGCINCIHVQPYVKAWYDTYAKDGFVVLGVHTPELSFEREIENVRDAVAKADVRFPVAFDPEWRTFKTWLRDKDGNPVFTGWTSVTFLLDKKGVIREVHPGGQYVEGDPAYAKMQQTIERLLAEPG